MGTYRIQIQSTGGTTTTTTRYSRGWRAPDQDRRPAPRVARIQSQNYEEIKKHCLEQGALWEDPDFPATSRSIYYSVHRDFEWKRPGEITDDPHMFVGGTSRFDIQQGDLGNCWFLAALASLCATKNQELVRHVIPEDNSFTRDYAGVFHFQIWQYGKWVDVVVDDRLPVINGRLMFVHSASTNEFWSALLEKAYAKLNGSYEALQGGCSSEAMEDFTGGVCETFNFRKKIPDDLPTILHQAEERCSLMGCTIDATGGQIESVLANGLVMGHAYSITGYKQIDVGGRRVNLLRIRNPWGNQYEWTGPWGDKSPEWNGLSDAHRAEMGLNFEEDGEFWMSLDDFTANFDKLEICFLTPGMLEELSMKGKKDWASSIQDGSWKIRVNAGGCRNFLDTFWTNPQYRMEVIDADEHDDENLGTMIVALLQKERRKKKREGLDHLTIGYMIYKIEDPHCPPLDLNFFKYNQAVGRSPVFSNMREICGRHRLAPGHYVVIPCTFKPHEEADFLLRIFSERQAHTCELDEETGMMEDEEDKKEAPVPPPRMQEAEAQRRRRRVRAITQDDVDEEKLIRDLFKQTAGEDLEVDAYQLRGILNKRFMREFQFDGFSLETARSMVAMRDADTSGKLSYDEFKTLWKGLRRWKKVFKEFDQDNSGTLNSYELREALNSAGMRVSNWTFNSLVMRYSDQQGKILFNCFMLCAVRLKTMFDIYKLNTVEGTAQFNMDQFIQTTMYT